MSQSEEKVSDRLHCPVLVKEEFEPVIIGGVVDPRCDPNRLRPVRDPSIKGQKKKCDCKGKDCRHGKPKKTSKREKRDQSLIGEADTSSLSKQKSAPRSIGSTTERGRQRALKVDAPNKIGFRCPHCDAALHMHVTKRKEWDDSDSLSDAKDEWSRSR